MKQILRKMDAFAVPFSFKHRSNDKYGTALGGFFVFLFCIAVIVIAIYYFIPFINRKNFTIVYYTMNIPKTEKVKLKDSKAAFAVGIDCESSNSRFTVDNILNLDVQFITYNKHLNGTYNKQKKHITNHPCTYKDFYNNFNDSFDYLNLKIYRCLDDYDHTLEGIYADQIFSYYEFTVASKENTTEGLNKVDEFLFETDCKFQIFYTDITINLDNYKEPMKDFLNTFFIQLSPILFIKRNLYFMNQYLYDDDYLFWVFSDESPTGLKTLFSRYEEYSLYLGSNRGITNPPNRANYAKIYMRADTKKTDIKRRYQKIMEFYADASSLLIGIYEILLIIFSYINTFYAEYSISSKLFLFKEIEGVHFNFSKNYQRIKNIMAQNEDDNNNDTNEIPEEDKNHLENNNHSNMEEIVVYNNKHENNIHNNQIVKQKIQNKKKVKNSFHLIPKISKMKNEDEIGSKSKLEYKKDNEDLKPQMELNIEENIKYSFNICEILNILTFNCCMTKNLRIKNILNTKAIDILNHKLDIVLYIRNMILFDIFNETILDESKISIINFLCRPILSINKKEENKFNELYHNYKENDFDSFLENISNLLKKDQKEEKEKILVELCCKEFKNLV